MLTQEELKSLLSYDPETGEFTWAVDRSPKVKKGHPAGSLHHTGYTYIEINEKHYAAHRLAWLYCYGSFPEKVIDHVNRQRNDNRISNLRDVSRSVNAFNTQAKGYSFNKQKNKYCASIRVNGKLKHLGCFLNPEQAKEAYEQAKSCLD